MTFIDTLLLQTYSLKNENALVSQITLDSKWQKEEVIWTGQQGGDSCGQLVLHSTWRRGLGDRVEMFVIMQFNTRHYGVDWRVQQEELPTTILVYRGARLSGFEQFCTRYDYSSFHLPPSLHSLPMIFLFIKPNALLRFISQCVLSAS